MELGSYFPKPSYQTYNEETLHDPDVSVAFLFICRRSICMAILIKITALKYLRQTVPFRNFQLYSELSLFLS